MRRHGVSSAALALMLAVSLSAAGPAKDSSPSPEKPASLRPKPASPLPRAQLQAAIQRGVDFLLADQNSDGSWGSAARTKGLNIMAAPGSHHAFRVAVTALAVSALIEAGGDSEGVRHAVERGAVYLVRELPKVRRADAMLIYNVWTHAYGIQALVHLYKRLPGETAKRAQIEGLIREQYDYLRRYESVQGGWGYYDFDAGTQRPDSSSMSFLNAAVLEAFHEAKEIGVAPPEKVLKRALAATRLQCKPDFSYLYGLYLRNYPMMGINRPGGSVGRSQACNLALRLWGDQRITDDVLKTWLDRLVSRNGWLDMGRKRPIPHESFMQVAGYFYYFGHYYGSLCVEQLPLAERPFYQDHLGHILLERQEKDGSWWDFPLYNYHQQYGTAFALMSLNRCKR